MNSNGEFDMYKEQGNETNPFGESLAKQIYRHILKLIIEGKLQSGDKIVEEEISKTLNTSRAPVREALYLLQVDGIVERIPRRGSVVKSFTQKEIDDYLKTTVHLIGFGIDQSSERWTEANQKEFRGLFKEVEEAYNSNELVDFQLRSEQLFRYIIFLTDNKALIRFYDEANHILSVFAQVQMNKETKVSFYKELSSFATAILQNDCAKAKVHVQRAIEEGAR